VRVRAESKGENVHIRDLGDFDQEVIWT